MDILAMLAIFLVSLSFYTSDGRRPISSFSISFCAIIAICVWLLCCLLWFLHLIRKLRNKPNNTNANKVVKMLKSLSPFSKLLIRSNLARVGISYEYLRETFNRIVYENQTISLDTKRQLRTQFTSLRVYNLKELPRPENIGAYRQETTGVHNSKKSEEEKSREFGRLGEDNVWHNLCTLSDLGGYDVFFDVNLKAAASSAQIDAIVVSDKAGVLLLEIKSYGGELDVNNIKTVRAHQLPPDLGAQIIRHRGAFFGVFSQLDLQEQQVKDMLVLSYPHKAQPRVVDYNSFSKNDYFVVSVDHLLDRITRMTGGQLSPEQRSAISAFLAKHSERYALSAKHNDTQPDPEAQADPVTPEQKQHFCTGCGKPLGDGAFCPHCGKKLY